MIDLFNRIRGPQAVVLCAFLAGVCFVVNAAISAPPEFWARVNWTAVGGFIVTVTGGGALALMKGVVASQPVRGPKSLRPPPPAPRPKRRPKAPS